MTSKWSLWVLWVFVLSLSTLVASQITVDVKLVTLVATVTDNAGRHIPNLKPQDFIVEEDGVFQTVTLLEQSFDVPVSVGVVLDTMKQLEAQLLMRQYEGFIK